MRVLIAAFDLFSDVGGGQTFYRSVIRRHPHIEFTYFRRSEAVDAPRPANANPVTYRQKYSPAALEAVALPGAPICVRDDFLLAMNQAFTVAGGSFDVLDAPDYERVGLFLRGASEFHRVRFDRLALSMHGAISTTLALNWGADGTIPMALRKFEKLQYGAADIRYCISRMYQEETQALSNERAQYIDPMWFFDPLARTTGVSTFASTGPPAVQFVGRTEKRKGPHLFLQLLQWLPRGAYGAARIIGPDSADERGTPSSRYLRELIRNRHLDVELVPVQSRAEMADRYASRSLTIVPSIYDTLNLVALESLFAGCPTVIGSGAGVCRYLREQFPQVPFQEIDIRAPYAAVPPLFRLMLEYDAHRERLERAVQRLAIRPPPPSLADVYAGVCSFDADCRTRAGQLFDVLLSCMELGIAGLGATPALEARLAA